ncbi:MAG TPA: hypothetical protein VFY78_05140, partial [Gammaproteobacteria bacterium]|nr:hypothetical protein [Gammaproteobacteria bacterium]
GLIPLFIAVCSKTYTHLIGAGMLTLMGILVSKHGGQCPPYEKINALSCRVGTAHQLLIFLLVY